MLELVPLERFHLGIGKWQERGGNRRAVAEIQMTSGCDNARVFLGWRDGFGHHWAKPHTCAWFSCSISKGVVISVFDFCHGAMYFWSEIWKRKYRFFVCLFVASFYKNIKSYFPSPFWEKLKVGGGVKRALQIFAQFPAVGWTSRTRARKNGPSLAS